MSSVVSRRRFVFGDYELLPERRLLLRQGKNVDLTAKAFDTLVILVEHSPVLVTKEELMAALWPNSAISENSLSSQIWTLRKTLGEGDWVRNVPRRGYQFVGNLELLPDDPANSSPLPSPPVFDAPAPRVFRSRLAWTLAGLAILSLGGLAWKSNSGHPEVAPQIPGVDRFIASVPFTAEGFSPADDFVADAITHSIRQRLENATQSWPDSRFENWKHVRRTGHVRKEDDRIVVDVQLVKLGRTIWSNSYSQPYPLAETVIGDVIGEHLGRLLEQGERRTSPSAKIFEAAGDFAVKPNASPWIYGMVRDWTGIGFVPFSQSFPYGPVECSSAGRAAPDNGVVCRTARPFEWQGIVLTPDALLLSTSSQFTTLRWVAPADGNYSVRGRIWAADTVARPARVKLVYNTLDTLMERRNFSGFQSSIPIELNLQLTQGASLDVILGPEIGVDYMSINVQLTIRPN